MRITRTLFISGIWVAVLPYLGFPYFWKNILFSISGVFLIFISYRIYRENQKNTQDIFDNFQENSDFGEARFELEIDTNSNA